MSTNAERFRRVARGLEARGTAPGKGRRWAKRKLSRLARRAGRELCRSTTPQ